MRYKLMIPPNISNGNESTRAAAMTLRQRMLREIFEFGKVENICAIGYGGGIVVTRIQVLVKKSVHRGHKR